MYLKEEIQRIAVENENVGVVVFWVREFANCEARICYGTT
jgi:hypothetical protein